MLTILILRPDYGKSVEKLDYSAVWTECPSWFTQKPIKTFIAQGIGKFLKLYWKRFEIP